MPDRRAIDLSPLRTPTGLLALAAGVVCVVGGAVTLATHPFMVDLEIPLRAADRWAHGGAPYLATGFSPDASGADLPFLYPPPLLPILAPFAALPRAPVVVAWLALLVGAAVWLLRRLGVPVWAVPLALAWVPFSEGLVGGNVQVVLVAAFVATFTNRAVGAWRPAGRDPARAGRPALADGLATAITPALKLSQPHGWVALLGRRPVAALAGLAALGLVALVTLPLTGLDAWRQWLDQVVRAMDPVWSLRGSSLVQLFPTPIAIGLEVAAVVAVLFVPAGRIAGGTGLLLVLGVPSLRNYGVLFLLPAMFDVRRPIALAGVILIGLGVAPVVWAGIGLVAAAYAMELRAARGALPASAPVPR